MKNGDDIQTMVQEVGVTDVKYKKFDNPNGTSYTVKKSDILMIRYANGTKDVFTEAADQAKSQNGNSGMSGKYNFLQMDDNEQESYLQANHPDLYERFHTGQKLSSVGKGLRIPGLILAGAGFGLMIAGAVSVDNSNNDSYNNYNSSNDLANNDMYIVGTAICSAGNALILISIPLSAVGGGIKKSVQNEYGTKYLGAKNFKGQFQFQLSRYGIGLAYVF